MAEFWLTTLSGFLAATLAVLATRFLEESRQQKERKLGLFRILMRDRGLQLTPDFVAALNLIEIEFKGDTPVIKAWDNLRTTYNKTQNDDVNKEKISNTVALLSAMAKSLGFDMDGLVIKEGSYLPNWMVDNLVRQNEISDLFHKMLSGQRPLHITAYQNNEPQENNTKKQQGVIE